MTQPAGNLWEEDSSSSFLLDELPSGDVSLGEHDLLGLIARHHHTNCRGWLGGPTFERQKLIASGSELSRKKDMARWGMTPGNGHKIKEVPLYTQGGTIHVDRETAGHGALPPARRVSPGEEVSPADHQRPSEVILFMLLSEPSPSAQSLSSNRFVNRREGAERGERALPAAQLSVR